MRGRRGAEWLCVWAMAAVALGGCGSDDAGSSTDATPVIVVDHDLDSLPTEGFHSLLTRDRGCLLLNGDIIAVWPRSAAWDDAAQAVTMDGRSAAVGSRFDGGGGSYPTFEGFASVIGPDAAARVDQCRQRTGVDRFALITIHA